MTVVIRLMLVLFAAFVTGCGSNFSSSDELDSKAEYSTLQYFELEHRSSKNSKPFIAIKRALDSEYDVIGLPQKGKAEGYVWLIANPGKQTEIIKIPTGTDFVIKRDGLLALQESVRMTPAVRDYLASCIVE